MRSHHCGQVDHSLIGKEITVAGWVHRRRDHGGVIFVDLRDGETLLQVVFDPEDAKIFAEAERIRGEFVLTVTGQLRERPEGTVNPEMFTGEELRVIGTVWNRTMTPWPFDPMALQVAVDRNGVFAGSSETGCSAAALEFPGIAVCCKTGTSLAGC